MLQARDLLAIFFYHDTHFNFTGIDLSQEESRSLVPAGLSKAVPKIWYPTVGPHDDNPNHDMMTIQTMMNSLYHYHMGSIMGQ